jgi:hypothetical protein
MPDVILVPVQQALLATLATAVQNNWCGNNAVVTTLNQNQLGGLELAPSSLYIIGHGNFGLGVGTSATHYGARRPAQILVNEGLVPIQFDLHIYVVACNSGVAMQRLGPLAGRRAPYVERLANALANQQFDNTVVHGFAGFVNANLISKLKLNHWTQSPSAVYAAPLSLSNPPYNREVVYTVTQGAVNPYQGRNWRGTSSLTSTRIT